MKPRIDPNKPIPLHHEGSHRRADGVLVCPPGQADGSHIEWEETAEQKEKMIDGLKGYEEESLTITTNPNSIWG